MSPGPAADASPAPGPGRLEIVAPAAGPDWRGWQPDARHDITLDIVDTGRRVAHWSGHASRADRVLSVSRSTAHWMASCGLLAASHADIDAACDAV